MATRAPVSSIVIVVVLCACAPVAKQQTGARLVGDASALAVPAPGGPAVVAVVERRYSNAVEQTIALETRAATGGQNSLGVRILGLARTWGDDALVPTVMTEASIAGEMRSAFPGVMMTISPAFLQNVYGPFGYAVGRGAGRDLCFYGWQRIADEVTTPFVRQGAIDTRLRLCQSGADEPTLLAGMYGYTVQAAFGPGWSTGIPVAAPSAAIGAPGVPIYPAPAQMVSTARPPEAIQPVRTPRKRSAPPAEEGVEAADLPAAATTPIVPLPRGLSAPKHTVARPVVPMPLRLAADASPVAMQAAEPGMPLVPSPPARVTIPGLFGGVMP